MGWRRGELARTAMGSRWIYDLRVQATQQGRVLSFLCIYRLDCTCMNARVVFYEIVVS